MPPFLYEMPHLGAVRGHKSQPAIKTPCVAAIQACSCFQSHFPPEDVLLFLRGREDDAGQGLSGEPGTPLNFQVSLSTERKDLFAPGSILEFYFHW